MSLDKGVTELFGCVVRMFTSVASYHTHTAKVNNYYTLAIGM